MFFVAFLTSKNKNYNLLNFYNLNTEFIVSNIDQWDVKRIWEKSLLMLLSNNKNIVSEIIVLIQKSFLLITLVDQRCVRARLGRIKMLGF